MSEDYAGLVKEATGWEHYLAVAGLTGASEVVRRMAEAITAQRQELIDTLAAMTTERDDLLAAHRQRDIVDLALEQQHTQAEAALALAQTERKQARALLVRCPEAVRLALSYIESRLDDSYWNRMVALDADLRAALGEGRP